MEKYITDEQTGHTRAYKPLDIPFRNKAKKRKNELIEQIICEFYTSMQNPVIINELAKKFSISTNYLIREFKKSTGKTPAQYAIDMRIKKAEELLLFSNYTNAQISEFLGFSNYSYFSRLFKKHTGVTPSEYRRRSQYTR